MITVIQISTEYGKLTLELEEPVDTEEEAFEQAIVMIHESMESANVAQTW